MFHYDELRFAKLENIPRRILNAETPQDAFPNRYDGDTDIETLRFFMSTHLDISPIVFCQQRNTLILLDGMHRLIAAHLRCLYNARVKALVIGMGELCCVARTEVKEIQIN